MDLSKSKRSTYLSLDNIYIRFGSKLYKQNVGIPMGTNCTPLLLICFYFAMRETSRSLSQRKNGMTLLMLSIQLLDTWTIYSISIIFTLNRWFTEYIPLNANVSDTEAAFFDLNLSIHNDTVSTKIYDKTDDFDFDIVYFHFLDGDVPRRPAYSV